jgi:hypothetical protein
VGRFTVAKPFGLNHPKFKRRLATVERTESGCWLWTGLIGTNGYGRYGKGNKYAHRLSYEYFVGPIPEGLFVCHHCDVRPCVNPAHLFVGTVKDNAQDMMAKGRRIYKRGEDTPTAKLTEEQVLEIRAQYRAWNRSASTTALGKKYGIDRKHIWNIVKRDKWKHI